MPSLPWRGFLLFRKTNLMVEEVIKTGAGNGAFFGLAEHVLQYLAVTFDPA